MAFSTKLAQMVAPILLGMNMVEDQWCALFMMSMNAITVAQGMVGQIVPAIGPVIKLFRSTAKPAFKAAFAVLTYWLVVYKFIKKAAGFDMGKVRIHKSLQSSRC
jgi:hypothetical protein|eukprot:COSAG06_NODE_4655_length_4061_cov_146.185817_1_plen_105_part_10